MNHHFIPLTANIENLVVTLVIIYCRYIIKKIRDLSLCLGGACYSTYEIVYFQLVQCTCKFKSKLLDILKCPKS